MDFDDITEEETKFRMISPVLSERWNPDRVEMERPIDKGMINLETGEVVRSKRLCKPDYVLRTGTGFPIAVIEAKKASLSVEEGMSQAQGYAKKLDSPFAYSTNGRGFREYDAVTNR